MYFCIHYFKVMDTKIAIFEKVSDITDQDFINLYRDIILSCLDLTILQKTGVTDRKVLIKKVVFEKNKNHHPELNTKESRRVLSDSLTKMDYAINDKPKGKPNYWILVHVDNEYNTIVNIDVDPQKSYLEVVGWRKVRNRSINQLKNRAIREGSQILITQRAAAGLSALTDNSAFDNKNSNFLKTQADKKLFFEKTPKKSIIR